MGPDGDKRTKCTVLRNEEKQGITRDKNVTSNTFSKHYSDSKSLAGVAVAEESDTARGQQVKLDQRESQSDKEDGETNV